MNTDREVMQAYRHERLDAAMQFEHVKRCIREFYRPTDKAEVTL